MRRGVYRVKYLFVYPLWGGVCNLTTVNLRVAGLHADA